MKGACSRLASTKRGMSPQDPGLPPHSPTKRCIIYKHLSSPAPESGSCQMSQAADK